MKKPGEGNNNAGNPISEFFQRMTFESIIQLVHSLSYDYIQNPKRYNGIPENIHVILSDFRYKTGSDPDWPNALQRAKLYDAILGKTFWNICKCLRRGAVTFTEQGSGKGEEIVRRSFQDELVTLGAYLKTLDELNVHNSESQTRRIFENAVIVLRSPEIASALGLQTITENEWPLEGVFSSKGAKLIEEISKKLSNRPEAIISIEKFLNIQRVAYYGKLTISGVIGTSKSLDNSDNTDKIIEHAYRWSKALYNLASPNADITIRAWKEPAFRLSLTIVERSFLPEHPSGLIDFSGTELASVAPLVEGMMAQSQTASGERCCSTVDPCANSEDICMSRDIPCV